MAKIPDFNSFLKLLKQFDLMEFDDYKSSLAYYLGRTLVIYARQEEIELYKKESANAYNKIFQTAFQYTEKYQSVKGWPVKREDAGTFAKVREAWIQGKYPTGSQEVFFWLCYGVEDPQYLNRVLSKLFDKSIDRIRQFIRALGNPRFNIQNQPSFSLPPPNKGIQHFSSEHAIDILGRKEERQWLEDFLDDDENFCWMQLAGVGGQGKSRLAWDLIQKAKKNGWAAGFLQDSDLEKFKNKWKDWVPDCPHLLVFDYVVGRTKEIGKLLQTLSDRSINEPKGFAHDVRILFVERKRWDQGGNITLAYKKNKQENQSQLLSNSERADWFIDLTTDRHDGFESSFYATHHEQKPVIELKKLSPEDLREIVKQVQVAEASGKPMQFSDAEIDSKLETIDAEGRPLYAYFLGIALGQNDRLYEGIFSFLRSPLQGSLALPSGAIMISGMIMSVSAWALPLASPY